MNLNYKKMKNSKKILLLLFFLLINYTLITENSHAQWIRQYEATGFVHLYDVKFIDGQTGWACGNNGTIMATTNGGQNWILQDNPATGKLLYSIYPVNSQIVYCVGWFQTILKTTNGGIEWIAIRNGQVGDLGSLQGVYFLNENTGWIIGTGGTVYKTTNGCETLDSVFLPTSYLFDVYFINETEGLICGEGADIYKTTNGGLNWFTILVPHGTQVPTFRNFTFLDQSTGYIISMVRYRVFKTTNFGSSWEYISEVSGPYYIYSIYFSSEFTGWICGGNGYIFKSTNGGNNWRQENTTEFSQGYLGSLYFLNDNTGWAVGAATKILHTTTGGEPLLNVTSNNEITPDNFELFQNYPNPFNPETNISYSLKINSEVKLSIFDILGREVAVLINERQNAGKYNFKLSVDDYQLTSGIYFYKLSATGGRDKFIQTKKMVITK
jgi:photosystem II stability/assembly factor-like uncharacterized protein